MSVCVVDRQNAKIAAHRQMDLKLLSSPLLVRLTYVIYHKGYTSEQFCRSEWPKLTRALLSGGNIRNLRLQSERDGTQYYGVEIVEDTEPKKLARLDLDTEANLTKLEELGVRGGFWGFSTYLWDADHCQLLSDSINTSHLRKLDFGGDNPETFFTTFAGILPALRHLRFGAVANCMEPAKNLIDSSFDLESLYVEKAQQGIYELWPAIKRHRYSLKRLILGPTWGSYCYPEYLERELLETVAQNFPKVEHLGWFVPCGTSIDEDCLDLLSTMNLCKIDLFLHIPTEDSDFSTKLVQNAMGSIPPPSLDKKRSTAAAMKIADAISQEQDDPLERLTLHNSRTGYQDRAQPYLMHTALQLRWNGHSITGNDTYDVRGKMDWYSVQSLEEELLFEEEDRD